MAQSLRTMDSAPLGAALLISLLVQGGGVAYLVLEVPPPPRPTARSIMDDQTIMAMLLDQPEPPPDLPEDDMGEPVAAVEPEPEPEPQEEEEDDELEMPDEVEEAEPEVVELEPLPEPEAIAAQGFGASDRGLALASGGRTVAEAAELQRSRRGRRRAASDDEGSSSREQEDQPEERERRRPVRLEDARTPPRLVRGEPEIGYPREFREQAVAGLVVVQCVITDGGRVRGCRRRGGPEQLADYVISIVRRWRYDPARDHDENRIAVAYTFRVPFRLL